MIILGIETSCDETAVAVVENGCRVLSSVTYSQFKEHDAYQGVVPEIAARSHLQKILVVFDQALKESGVSISDIDAIAVTSKPGLMGALIIGVVFAKSLSLAHKIPLIDVHHIYGHLISAGLDQLEQPAFPLIALIASGGHTTLIQAKSFFDFKTLGRSIDDAAGEALDKAAKLLELGFPGGPAIEAFSQGANPHAYSFPYPMPTTLDFSFSGLKTSLLTKLKKSPSMNEKDKKDLACSFQEAIMSTLVRKLKQAQEKTKIDRILICGGVAKNKILREKIKNEIEPGKLYLTPMQYCTDNAAMIAGAGYYTYQKHGFADLDLIPTANASLV